MNKNLVITIARQYGSGGREIGVRVAELLGIKSYDKELITMAAQKSGMSPEAVGKADEKATSSLLYTLAMGSSVYGNTHGHLDMPINDKLFITQSEIIKELTEESDCVIIGRCGDYVLRDHPRVISVFIYADFDSRVERVMRQHGLSEADAKSLVTKTDKRRTNYYNFYTGRKWGKYDHYHASLDSGLLGIEGTARIIADIAKQYSLDN
jgi:cytidylate kinase